MEGIAPWALHRFADEHAAQLVKPGVGGQAQSTGWVCAQLVKPATQARRCAYADVMQPGSSGAAAVGRATVFASHAWGNPFPDLVAALEAALSPDDFVWLDIFTVRWQY